MLVAVCQSAVVADDQDDEQKLDLDTYLKRELQNLKAADPDKLSDSMKRVRATLKDDADTGDMLLAWFAEYHRRLAESDEFKDRKFAPLRPVEFPAGTNGWEDLMKAGERAQQYEEANGYGTYGEVVSGRPLPAKAAADYLKDTTGARELAVRATQAEHITQPGFGLTKLVYSTPETALWRVLSVRVHAQLALDDRTAAAAEANDALRLIGRTEFGGALIHELFALLANTVTLQGVLLSPTWKADELETLLEVAPERKPRPDWALFSEALYVVVAADSMAKTEKKEVNRAFKLIREGNTPLGDLLERGVTSNLKTIKLRADAAEWIRQNPGELRDAGYCKRLLEHVKGDGAAGWSTNFANMLEPHAWLLAVKIKLAWLRGKRGDEFSKAATTLADETQVFSASVEDRTLRVRFKADHPLALKDSRIPICEFDLVGE